MKAVEVIDALTTQFRLDTRAKFKQDETPSKWGWFIVLVPGYIESSAYGPVPSWEVEWVEIDPIEQRRIGRLVPRTSLTTRRRSCSSSPYRTSPLR
jgi:hypothetical protein